MDQNKPKIDIPIKIIFNEEGETYFTSKGKRIGRFKLSDGTDEPGIELTDFMPMTIQRMQLLGYVSKIEVPLSNVYKHRKDMIDVIKLITYGMLYRQFDTQVFGYLVDSPLITNWNRHNLKNPIDFKTKINVQVLEAALNKNATEVRDIHHNIIGPAQLKIKQSETLNDSEKRVQNFLCEKFLKNLNPLIYFILSMYRGSSDAKLVIQKSQRLLVQYIARSSIPEYLALMMVELLMSINMMPGTLRGIPREKEKEMFCLFRISRKRPEANDRGRLHIMIANEKSSYDNIRQTIQSKVTTQVQGKSLKDFYDSSPDLGEGMNLGLYYLSYLSEACKKVGINLESFVNRSELEGHTLIHLILTF